MHVLIDLPLRLVKKSNEEFDLSDESMSMIDKWLNEKGVDGIRVKIPFEYINQSLRMSFKTMKQWNELVENISKKGQTK